MLKLTGKEINVILGAQTILICTYDFVFRELGGNNAPDDWTGRLNVTYKIGGSFSSSMM